MNNATHERPLRILQVVDTLDAGGMEHQLVSLLNRLDPNLFQFEVCCLRHAGVNATKLRQDVPVHPLEKAEGFQPATARHMRTLLTRRFDLIHTHNLAPLIYAVLATVGGTAAPIFHGEHSQLTAAELGRKRLWQRRLLYRATRAVHTVSAGQRDELRRAGLSHPRLTAILNGVDTDRFKPLPDEAARAEERARAGFGKADEIWIGIIARFGAFKRHAHLIEAFEAVTGRRRNLRLLMIGDGGPEKEAVLDQMHRSSATDRIHWLGYQADPAPWYPLLDLLAVPSSNEGLSNTTLEAMSAGVPVLSNDICGARELISEAQGGWVRDLSGVERLTQELDRALSLTPAERRLVGARGRNRASELFSWRAMAENYAAWFYACARRGAFPQ